MYHMLLWETYILWEAAGGDKDAPPAGGFATKEDDPNDCARDCSGYNVHDLLSDSCVQAKLQGDDGVCCVPYDSPMSLVRYRYFCRKYWDITVKAGPPTEENDYFFSLVDKGGHVVREGVVFLQRRFVRAKVSGIVEILPFRPVRDYWGRLGRGTGVPLSDGSPGDELKVMAYYRMRWVGLLHDTMETNRAASEFVREALDWLDRTNPLVVDYCAHLAESPDLPHDVRRMVAEVQAYALKIGPDMLGFDFVKVPDRGSIIGHFVGNSDIQRQRKIDVTYRSMYPQDISSAH